MEAQSERGMESEGDIQAFTTVAVMHIVQLGTQPYLEICALPPLCMDL